MAISFSFFTFLSTSSGKVIGKDYLIFILCLSSKVVKQNDYYLFDII
jgi:hypothetical protein